MELDNTQNENRSFEYLHSLKSDYPKQYGYLQNHKKKKELTHGTLDDLMFYHKLSEEVISP